MVCSDWCLVDSNQTWLWSVEVIVAKGSRLSEAVSVAFSCQGFIHVRIYYLLYILFIFFPDFFFWWQTMYGFDMMVRHFGSWCKSWFSTAVLYIQMLLILVECVHYMWMDVIVRYRQVYNCVNSRSVLLAVRADNHKHEFHISTRHWHNTATTLHLKPNSKIRYLQTALNWFLSLSFFYFSCLEFGVYTSVFSMIYIYTFCCQKVTWYAERSLRIKRRKSIPVSPSANGDFVHKILVKRIKIVTVWSFYFVHCFVWISVS